MRRVAAKKKTAHHSSTLKREVSKGKNREVTQGKIILITGPSGQSPCEDSLYEMEIGHERNACKTRKGEERPGPRRTCREMHSGKCTNIGFRYPPVFWDSLFCQ